MGMSTVTNEGKRGTFEFSGEVLRLEQIYRDLLEIDLVRPASGSGHQESSGRCLEEPNGADQIPAEDDDGAAGLRPPVGVYLDWRHGGASRGNLEASRTGFRSRVPRIKRLFGLGALQPELFFPFRQKKANRNLASASHVEKTRRER